MNNDVEIWKDVPNYEWLYQVSSFGRVKSFIPWKGTNERILKIQKGGMGYLHVSLAKNGKQKIIKVHVLVAIVFHGHIPDGLKIVVDHKDNNKLNNRADNLKLITQRENTSKDRKNTTSKYVGVAWDKRASKWAAKILFKRRNISLGFYDIEVDAANAYQKALKELEQGLDLNILYPLRVDSSQYLGVYWSNNKNKWVAIYKNKFLGYYKTELEAHEAVLKIKDNK